MPPHCDSMDGPVVTAARQALKAHDVDLVLPYVKREHEPDVVDAYDLARTSIEGNAGSEELASRYFFETVVRLHRAGEDAPYTGLKPAGLGFGPVVPVAEEGLGTGSPDALVQLLTDKVRTETLARFERAMALKAHAGHGVPAAREYVEAMLDLEVWSHTLYQAASASGHGAHGESEPAAAAGHDPAETLVHSH